MLFEEGEKQHMYSNWIFLSLCFGIVVAVVSEREARKLQIDFMNYVYLNNIHYNLVIVNVYIFYRIPSLVEASLPFHYRLLNKYFEKVNFNENLLKRIIKHLMENVIIILWR